MTTTFKGWIPEAPPPRCNLISRGCVVFGQNHGSYNAGFLLKPFFNDLHLTRCTCNQDFSPLFVKRFSSLFEATFGRFAESNYEIEKNRNLRECFFCNRPNNSSSRLWEQNSLLNQQQTRKKASFVCFPYFSKELNRAIVNFRFQLGFEIPVPL